MPRACVSQEKPVQWEARTPQRRVSLLTTATESPRAAMETQHNQKYTNKLKKNILIFFNKK